MVVGAYLPSDASCTLCCKTRAIYGVDSRLFRRIRLPHPQREITPSAGPQSGFRSISPGARTEALLVNSGLGIKSARRNGLAP